MGDGTSSLSYRYPSIVSRTYLFLAWRCHSARLVSHPAISIHRRLQQRSLTHSNSSNSSFSNDHGLPTEKTSRKPSRTSVITPKEPTSRLQVMKTGMRNHHYWTSRALRQPHDLVGLLCGFLSSRRGLLRVTRSGSRVSGMLSGRV